MPDYYYYLLTVLGCLTSKLFLSNNLLNLFTCLSLTLMNLNSLTLLMNSLHLCCVVVLITMENNLDLLAAILPSLYWRMSLMDLTLSCRSCFSALLITFLALLLISFLLEFSLALTGTNLL